MPNVDIYLDEIDAERISRVKELSEIKYRFGNQVDPDPSNIASKAVVVLTYANWEGFYNQCVQIYVRFLRSASWKVRDIEWTLLVGVLTSDFSSLRDRDHSPEARQKFTIDLKERLDSGFDSFDESIILARSNFDFKRISQNFAAMNFELNPLQKFRIRLDKELVGWRHGVAHGEQPDLSALDIAGHVDYTSELLFEVAGTFQQAIVRCSSL